MKKLGILSLLSILLMSSCEFNLDTFSNESNKDNSSSDTNQNKSDTISSTIDESYPKEIRIFGINDFHGSVIEKDKEAGIVKLGSFLKAKKDEGNTLLINSGDMFQGSIESNYNYGKLLTDCMNYIGFDCFTLGNHEFDWGVKYINQNRNIISYDHQTPFLAANIYNYDISNKKTLDYADLGDKYTIVNLENGLKVGIIGVIGEEQITSISSQYVDEYTFLDPTPIIKELSDELRMEKDCDVVILSSHASQDQILKDNYGTGTDNAGITKTSNKSNKRYVDAIFCAHSHANEKKKINGVPIVQASSNGKMYATITLNVNESGKVSCDTYSSSYTTSISSTFYDEDLDNIVKEYKKESDIIGNEKLGYSYDTFNQYEECINLMDYAMYSEALEQGYDVDYAICNNARYSLPYGDIYYRDLYKSYPFDNEVYIIEASGKDVLKEASACGVYRATKEALVESKTYKVAVIDYLAFHRNSRRYYDYFTSVKVVGKLTKEGKDIYSYRDVLAEYLRTHNTKLDTDDYSSLNDRFNRDILKQKIS